MSIGWSIRKESAKTGRRALDKSSHSTVTAEVQAIRRGQGRRCWKQEDCLQVVFRSKSPYPSLAMRPANCPCPLQQENAGLLLAKGKPDRNWTWGGYKQRLREGATEKEDSRKVCIEWKVPGPCSWWVPRGLAQQGDWKSFLEKLQLKKRSTVTITEGKGTSDKRWSSHAKNTSWQATYIPLT